jgi:hypothetical protein
MTLPRDSALKPSTVSLIKILNVLLSIQPQANVVLIYGLAIPRGTKIGLGITISEWPFVSRNINTNNFMKDVGDKVTELLRQLNEEDSNRERRKFALKTHRELLRQAAEFKEPMEQEDSPGLATYDFTNTCFSCLFGRPEYSLPCGHVICKTCTRDFDQTEEG